MCRVIALSNSKGGTGKTTTCMNLGIGLVRKGFKVLLIDNDSQGSLTACMGIQKKEGLKVTTKSVLQKVLTGEDFDFHEGILHHEEGVDLLPANGTLADLQLLLQGRKNGELLMKQYIDVIRDEYHYILIDCPPSLSYITLNALCCADSVLIPMEAAFMSVMGLDGIRDFEAIAGKYNVDFAVKQDQTVKPPKYLVFFKKNHAEWRN